jgi:hypothetical protein
MTVGVRKNRAVIVVFEVGSVEDSERRDGDSLLRSGLLSRAVGTYN